MALPQLSGVIGSVSSGNAFWNIAAYPGIALSLAIADA